MPVKAHAFGDLKKLNLEPYVTLHVLLPHWGATQFPNINPEFSISAQKRGYPIFGSSPSYSDTQLIPKQVGPHLWELHSSTMRRLRGGGLPCSPHRVGGACGHQDHTTPPSPWSLQLDFHPLHPTATPLPTVTLDHIITKSKASSAFICPKFLLHIWQSDRSYILKIPLASLMILSSRISSSCDHSFVKSSSSYCP